LESRTPRTCSVAGTTAPTVTGPAQAPRPTSSMPTTTRSPASQNFRSSRSVGPIFRVGPEGSVGAGSSAGSAGSANSAEVAVTAPNLPRVVSHRIDARIVRFEETRAVPKASTFKTVAARDTYFTAYDDLVASAPMPVTHRDVLTPFGTTHVLLAGDRSLPPLVALHGKMMSATMWLPHLTTLSATHAVVMLDTIGDLGRSIAASSMRTRGDIVTWLDTVLRELMIDRATFVGNSYGAWMATTYAIARPARVERLALIAPAGVFARVRLQWMARAISSYAVRPSPARSRRFIESMCASQTLSTLPTSDFGRVIEQHVTGAPEFRGASREAYPRTYDAAALSALSMPVLFVVGREETVCNGPRSAALARKRLPRARVELIDDANHAVLDDQQELVDRTLAEFLA
jgi:pimeloyl-ACP methyl ester carboxylesterase